MVHGLLVFASIIMDSTVAQPLQRLQMALLVSPGQ